MITNHNPQKSARSLERALIKIMRADAAVYAERLAADEAIWHAEACEKMRARANERAAVRRKLKSQTAAVPPAQRRRIGR